ncbi:MAG: PilZ domain-containing protein [Deltaproteobacteria bacterium]|nr:PilZ domain-containing protein [Deltaproteobacteria bacterium]
MPGEKKADPQRREFSRVKVQLPVDIRLVPPEEQSNIRAHVSGRYMVKESACLPDVQDKLLAEWLKLLNSKLDTIIRMLTLQEEGLGSLPFNSENISGGGLSFTSPHLFSPGDILEIKTILSAMQPVMFCLYGEVVKIEKRGQDYLTSVKFIAIDEPLRDEIVRFVFEMERESLRKQKGELFP